MVAPNTVVVPALLAARLGPGVRHEVKVVGGLTVYRFTRPDVYGDGRGLVSFLRVIGSGEDWESSYSDAVRELARPLLIQQAVEAATRDDI